MQPKSPGAARLRQIIGAFSSRKLLVVGDLIADEFLYGQIARVSREAPVLVLQYRNLVRSPGGAANAANNLLDLGCHVRMMGAVGPDASGDGLKRMLAEKGADVRQVRRIDDYDTPVKTRILASAHHSSPQQIVRVDRIAEKVRTVKMLQAAPQSIVRGIDGIIISDYGYGTITQRLVRQLRNLARLLDIPLVVDSRFRMGEFRGVTAITPNITELEESAGLSIGSDAGLLHKTGQEVIRHQRLRCLLVTQGRYGMTLFQMRRKPVHIPIFGTDEVADVTGAGDTVIAVFTLALACGASPGEAASLANYAGGIVVMKRGTATVTGDELRAAIKTTELPRALD